jgi:hypothetical protein
MTCTFCRTDEPFVIGVWPICAQCAGRAEVSLIEERGEWHGRLTLGNQHLYLYTSERAHVSGLEAWNRTLELIAGKVAVA